MVGRGSERQKGGCFPPFFLLSNFSPTGSWSTRLPEFLINVYFDRRHHFAPRSNFLPLSSGERERLGRACSPQPPLNSPSAPLNSLLLPTFFNFWTTLEGYVKYKKKKRRRKIFWSWCFFSVNFGCSLRDMPKVPQVHFVRGRKSLLGLSMISDVFFFVFKNNLIALLWNIHYNIIVSIFNYWA